MAHNGEALSAAARVAADDATVTHDSSYVTHDSSYVTPHDSSPIRVATCHWDCADVAQSGGALPLAAQVAVDDAAASRNTDLQQRAVELQALLRYMIEPRLEPAYTLINLTCLHFITPYRVKSREREREGGREG